eukprot:CAMPEP_0194323768 /NCGR_PEP_ID=MMETSP0171-20130528/25954_1 /TAXON_ID=218684 /ORGANISM="Corethron pennatum, Strain L29A3" /LENGTH=188 /DNA_ID=CAMNT_0039082491 /DNA_START=74 /DNA_END=636 /DNA_ORIENTATION=-
MNPSSQYPTRRIEPPHHNHQSSPPRVQSIYDRPLGGNGGTRPGPAVSLSAFALLYSELVQYHQNKSSSMNDLEGNLERCGMEVGTKVLELVSFRERSYKRETRLMNILHHLSITIWRYLFGRSADSLERSMDNDDEYMIYDDRAVTSSFCNVRSVDAFVSGIIAGVLNASGFGARVTAHSVSAGGDEG